MKKKIIVFDKKFINFRRSLILKNSINFIFFKKLKNLIKKNLFVNFFFINKFINFYKNQNLLYFLKNFDNNNLNFYFIYNLNNFKNQFIYNINFTKSFIKNKNLDFLFLTKNKKKNYFINNCFFLNSKNIDFDNNFFENFVLIKKNNFFSKTENFFLFLNFNLYLFMVLELYKFKIFLFIKNL